MSIEVIASSLSHSLSLKQTNGLNETKLAPSSSETSYWKEHSATVTDEMTNNETRLFLFSLETKTEIIINRCKKELNNQS